MNNCHARTTFVFASVILSTLHWLPLSGIYVNVKGIVGSLYCTFPKYTSTPWHKSYAVLCTNAYCIIPPDTEWTPGGSQKYKNIERLICDWWSADNSILERERERDITLPVSARTVQHKNNEKEKQFYTLTF